MVSSEETQATTKVENVPKGIYMHGDVGKHRTKIKINNKRIIINTILTGCGKSFLMDLFYENTPHQRKRRIHFHHFMHDVHGSMNCFIHYLLPYFIMFSIY